jgi:hypothetical protein
MTRSQRKCMGDWRRRGPDGRAVAGLWLLLRKRPTPEELERARRQFLAHSGRLVDGMLLDICEVEAPQKSKNEPARTLTMLVYSYRIGGVDYESSQDITGHERRGGCGPGAGRLPLLGALPAGQSPEQHRGGRRVERAAGRAAGAARLRDPDPIDLSHLEAACAPVAAERKVLPLGHKIEGGAVLPGGNAGGALRSKRDEEAQLQPAGRPALPRVPGSLESVPRLPKPRRVG